MIRARLQTRQAKFVQPSGDRVLMHFHLEPARHFSLQIHASPTNHPMDLRIGPCERQFEQFSPLQLAQARRPTWRQTRPQPFDACCVVAMHPVAQGLPVHAIELRRFSAWPPLQNHRQSQYAPNLSAVRATTAQRAQLRSRVLRTSNFQGCAHPTSPTSESDPSNRTHKDLASQSSQCHSELVLFRMDRHVRQAALHGSR